MDLSYGLISGRLTEDPKAVSVRDDTLCTFAVASNYGKGARQKTSYFNCVANGKIAATLLKEESFIKGLHVLVRGNMRIESYQTKDGQWRKSFKLYVHDWPMYLETKGDRINSEQSFADAVLEDPDVSEIPW
jgi:single-stranded DNA-binding protein